MADASSFPFHQHGPVCSSVCPQQCYCPHSSNNLSVYHYIVAATKEFFSGLFVTQLCKWIAFHLFVFNKDTFSIKRTLHFCIFWINWLDMSLWFDIIVGTTYSVFQLVTVKVGSPGVFHAHYLHQCSLCRTLGLCPAQFVHNNIIIVHYIACGPRYSMVHLFAMKGRTFMELYHQTVCSCFVVSLALLFHQPIDTIYSITNPVERTIVNIYLFQLDSCLDSNLKSLSKKSSLCSVFDPNKII